MFLQAAVFLIFRENSYIQVHDNLDLFAAQLQIMKNTDTFFAKDAILPMLGGISRDTFGSEFSLYNILFFLLPNFWAYLTGYALKIAIGIWGFCLLAKDVYGEDYVTYRPLILVLAAAFGMMWRWVPLPRCLQPYAAASCATVPLPQQPCRYCSTA